MFASGLNNNQIETPNGMADININGWRRPHFLDLKLSERAPTKGSENASKKSETKVASPV